MAQSGSVAVSGTLIAKDTVMEARRRVGIVFQDPDDQLFMPTIADDVAFGPQNLGLAGDELAARVDEALDAVDIRDLAERSPSHVSFGQKRRAAIAGVLAMRPDIIVLDEPTANLDPAARRELTEVLDSLDVTQLIVTHDLLYALELCPRSIIIDDGRIVADGSTRDLLADTELLAAHRLALPFGVSLEAQGDS
jgi:cobalt/nickel transport system ATP-binding protein